MNLVKKLITSSSFFGFFITGITISIAGPILIEIGRTFNKPINIIAIIFTMLYIGYALGPTTGNFLIKHFKIKIIILIIFFIQTLLLLLVSFPDNFFVVIIIFLLIGLCGGLLDMMLTAVLVRIHPDREGFFINISHVFFSLGAFMGPYFSMFSIKFTQRWQPSFQIVSIIALINFIFLFFIKIPYKFNSEINPGISKSNKINKILKIKNFKYLIPLLLLSCFLYTFAESGLNSWIPTYLRLFKSFKQISAGQVLSFFWLSISFGRIIVGYILLKINIFKTTISIIVLGAICIIIGIFADNSMISAIFFAITGLFFAGIFPNILAIGSIYFKEFSSVIIALLITANAIGGLLAPQIMGIMYKYFDLDKAFVIVSIATFTEAILIFCFMKMSIKKPKIAEEDI